MVKALTEEDLKEQKLQVSKSDGKLHEASQEIGTDKSASEVIPQPGARYDFIDPAGPPRP